MTDYCVNTTDRIRKDPARAYTTAKRTLLSLSDAIKRRFHCVLQEQVLFDHFGRLNQDLGRNRKAQGLRRLQVNDEVKLRRLLNR